MSANSSVAKRRRSGTPSKGVRFAPEPVAAEEAKPCAAIVIIRYILRHRVNRPMSLKRNRQQLEELRDTLKGYTAILETALNDFTLSKEDTQKLLAAWDTYLKLCVLLRNEDLTPTAIIAEVEDLMGWADCKIFNNQIRSPLGNGIVNHLLCLCSNMISIGLCDVNFVGHLVEVSNKVIPHG